MRGIRASEIHPINIFNFQKILLRIVILERGITDVNDTLVKERPGSLSFFIDAFKWENGDLTVLHHGVYQLILLIDGIALT